MNDPPCYTPRTMRNQHAFRLIALIVAVVFFIVGASQVNDASLRNPSFDFALGFAFFAAAFLFR